MTRLMPTTVRLIPFPALLSVLGLFLLMIGPADYFALGWLRRRRYTWIFFPVMSVGFMLVTVLMANHYLGLRDQRRGLVVVDVDKDGTALRWNRYELVFAARDRQSVTELKDALWAPLEAGATAGMVYNPRYGGYAPAATAGEAAPPAYEGLVPAHFQASEAIRQWQPRLNRMFSFELPAVPVPANWREAAAAFPDLNSFRTKLSGGKQFSGDIYRVVGNGLLTPDGATSGILPSNILMPLCVDKPEGFTSIVSQISPTGGPNFDDAPLLDPDSHDSLLLVVTEAGDDIVLYRRLFHGN
jgi:hypothetical protein